MSMNSKDFGAMTGTYSSKDVSDMRGSILCRLCEAVAMPKFALELIGHHHVQYYQCEGCDSLQTEMPYWLDEAYSNSNLAMLDTGVAQRNISNLAAIYAWVRLMKTQTVIDIGGGDGLLCRLLRDYNIDARLEDRYASNTYAQGFDEGERQQPVLCTAFEVLEHYAEPKNDLGMLFDNEPDAVIVTTALYEGQGPYWWYLTPGSGQHVFFYSRKAMTMIAARFHYHVDFAGHYTIFSKSRPGAIRTAVARAAMTAIGTRLIRSALMLLPTPGVGRDHNLIASRQ